MSKKDLKDNLLYENKNAFGDASEKEKAEIFDFCEGYKKFINEAKTEREFCEGACRELAKAGFVPLSSKKSLKAGDKVYTVNRGKGVIAAVIGKKDITEGINLVGAHIDSPRLDLKPNPLYEDNGIAYFNISIHRETNTALTIIYLYTLTPNAEYKNDIAGLIHTL